MACPEGEEDEPQTEFDDAEQRQLKHGHAGRNGCTRKRPNAIEDKYADRQLAGSIDIDFLSLMITIIKAMKNVCMNPKTAPAK